MAQDYQAGSKVWFIPDCYWPEITTGEHYVSHEAICVLNPSKHDAKITITLYFEDSEPMRGFTAECKAERTNHIRLIRSRMIRVREYPRVCPMLQWLKVISRLLCSTAA